MTRSESEREGFVRAQTVLTEVAGLNGLRLHTAAAAFPLWREAAHWHERGEIALPFWAFPWAGGLGLARHLMLHSALVAGREVTDVASGSGLVGIAAARAGAARVTCLDIDPLAATAARLNAAANGVDLQTVTADVATMPIVTGLIVAGDICYEGPMAAALLGWLRSCVAAGAEVWVGDPGRHYLAVEGLELVARYRMEVSADLEAGNEVDCSVYRLL